MLNVKMTPKYIVNNCNLVSVLNESGINHPYPKLICTFESISRMTHTHAHTSKYDGKKVKKKNQKKSNECSKINNCWTCVVDPKQLSIGSIYSSQKIRLFQKNEKRWKQLFTIYVSKVFVNDLRIFQSLLIFYR